jgi:pimeloyl-ACP methyl ester carboxylesterase
MTTNDTAPDRSLQRPDWLPHAQWPFPLLSRPIAGSPVHYVDIGEGPTLLFVHAGMWSFIWRDVIRDLSGDFRCIALDFPGSGLSPAPAGYRIGLANHATVLADFSDQLNLTNITLVMHDLGGPIGLRFAGGQPDRLRAMVLANTFGWWPTQSVLRGMLRLMGGRMMRALNIATNLVPRLTAGRMGVGRHLNSAGRTAFLGPTRNRAQRRAFHDLMRDTARSEPPLQAIEAALRGPLAERPVLTIFGQRNDPLHFQRRWHDLYPTATQVVVPKGNHFPMNDNPDLFAKTLRAWWHETVRDQDQG